MKPASSHNKTIRTRLTRVVLVPGLVLLVLWLAFAAYTGIPAFVVWRVGVQVQDVSIPAVKGLAAIQKERLVTMRTLSQSAPDMTELSAQRTQTDAAVETLRTKLASLPSNTPQDIRDKTTALIGLLDQLPQKRAKVPMGPATKGELFTYYNNILDAGADLFATQANAVSDAQAGETGLTATEIFRNADRMSRAASLGDGTLVAGQVSPDDHVRFAQLVGGYHTSLDTLMRAPSTSEDVRAQYQQLTTSDTWKRWVAAENELLEHGADMARGSQRPGFTISEQEWEGLASQVSDQLLGLATAEASDGAALGVHNGQYNVLVVGVASLFALLVVLAGLALAWWNSRKLVDQTVVSRLSALGNDSLRQAERLPAIMRRLETGENVDIRAELPPLHYGGDEIGQVAEAFNTALYAAVSAAVRENQAREGFIRLFLGIARRFQGLVRKQLQVIDDLERREHNPERFAELLQLDHLTTRAQRNAEKVIIIAGGKPGRQWREPVRLIDVLRSAVGEIEQYSRVQVTPVPDVAIVGAAVGDTIHLLAELLENATVFSHPRSPVRVFVADTPRGVLVEIEDQGLGMDEEDRAAANAMLATPPQFEQIVRGDNRWGLVVVSHLAARQQIQVTLHNSDGGTTAKVLMPPSLITGDTSAVEPLVTKHKDKKVPRALVTTIAGELPPPDTQPTRPSLDAAPSSKARPTTSEPAQPEPTRSSPEPTPVDDNDKPPLPKRKRQKHLAPQLAGTNGATEQSVDLSADEMTERSDRTRRSMAAIQHGTNEARRAGDQPQP